MSPDELETGKRQKVKGVVLMSGGLDSTVCATEACLTCDEVTLMFFNYKQKMFKRELYAVLDILHRLQIEFPNVAIKFELVELDFLSRLGKSYLTEHDKPVTEGAEALLSPTAWVPGRNIVFLSMAGAYAEANEYQYVYIGINLEEGETYPDNTLDFITDMNRSFTRGYLGKVVIRTPLWDMNKDQIVKRGLDINAPLTESWSCYYDRINHCGQCASCQIKKAAFKKNAISLPLDYWEDEKNIDGSTTI